MRHSRARRRAEQPFSAVEQHNRWYKNHVAGKRYSWFKSRTCCLGISPAEAPRRLPGPKPRTNWAYSDPCGGIEQRTVTHPQYIIGVDRPSIRYAYPGTSLFDDLTSVCLIPYNATGSGDHLMISEMDFHVCPLDVLAPCSTTHSTTDVFPLAPMARNLKQKIPMRERYTSYKRRY